MAARFLIPSLLTATALLAGCADVEATFELEMARNEAQYLPIEIGATMAMGVLRGAEFAELSAGIHAEGSTAGLESQPACVGVDLLDPMGGEDLHGTVRYDFSRCGSSAGFLDVEQRLLLPDLSEMDDGRDEPEGWDGTDIPEDWDGTIPTGDELEDYLTYGADVAMAVDFVHFEEGVLAMNGGVEMAVGLDGGALAADLDVGVLNYGGVIDVAGVWAPGIDLDEQILGFSGEFQSSTELDWVIEAHNLVLDSTCGDTRGGELQATFINDAGRVELRAVFSPDCDGCATVHVNGVVQGETCFDGSSLYGG